MFKKPAVRQYAVAAIVNLSTMTFGMNVVWSSPVLVKLSNETETVLSRPLTVDEGSWLASLGLLTSCLAFYACFLVDRIGRKYTLLYFVCLPKIAIAFMYTFAREFWVLLLARGISGLFEPVVLIVVPIYVSEVASKEHRGSIGTLLQIFSSIGVLIMLGFGPFLSYVNLNVMMICVTVAATIPLFFIPQSPYFLYSRGRINESLKALTFLRGSEELAKVELQDYAAASDETSEKVDKLQLIKNKTFLKAAGILIVLTVGFNLLGSSAISAYLQTILQSTGANISPEISSVIIGCMQLTASLCTTFVSERFGRRHILIVTIAGMSVGMIALGVFFKVTETNDVTGFLNVLPLASIMIIIFGYSAGPACLLWVLISELFDGPARGIGSTVNIFGYTVSMFLISRYFPIITASIGPAITYWIFGMNCILMCLFITFCLPETRGKSFKEIQDILSGKKSRDMDHSDTDCELLPVVVVN